MRILKTGVIETFHDHIVGRLRFRRSEFRTWAIIECDCGEVSLREPRSEDDEHIECACGRRAVLEIISHGQAELRVVPAQRIEWTEPDITRTALTSVRAR